MADRLQGWRRLDRRTKALLRLLRELDEGDVLRDVYGLKREDTAPLDEALYAWRDAGCPDTPKSAVRGQGVPRG